MAIEAALTAFKRVPFGGGDSTDYFVMVGKNWPSTGGSAAVYKMELRDEPGQTGTALVSLATTTAGTQGVSASYDSAYPDPETLAVVGATLIKPQIDEATIEALALASDPAEPRVMYYDLHVTPSGQPKRVLAFGTFTILPGVTI